MRMVHAVNETISEGVQEVKQTGVGGDAKIVYALLTGMVSDKVVYPVREYATNAWEVSPAGKPFEITLPTRFSAEYGIRDFGPGLSHRFMMNKYAKIGESTKDGDDEAVGGWGFGSKAALAYLMRSDGAGSFTVTSRHKGYRRVYVIGVSAQGKIQIQFLNEWPLEAEDRGTGLEIQFPVRHGDIPRFQEHAKSVLWSFEPRPVITPAIDFGRSEISHKGDGWTIYRGDTVPWEGPQVKIGPVMYPINLELAPDAEGWVTNEDHIVFEAKIGTISVSASREALQYDDRTEAGLKALFQHYIKDWMVKARADVDAEPTYLKARWKAREIADSLGWKRSWDRVREIGWRGFRFEDNLFPNNGWVKAAKWPELRGNAPVGCPVPFKADWSINPGELETRQVVIQHGSLRTFERLTVAGLNNTPCLLVRVHRDHMDWVLDKLGRPEYILLNDIKLPPAPRNPDGTRQAKRPEHIKRLRVMSTDCANSWSEYVDTSEEVVYAQHVSRGRRRRIHSTYEGNLRSYTPSELRGHLQLMKGNDLLDGDFQVVILGENQEPLPHWKSLADHLSDLLSEAIDPAAVAPTIPWSKGSFDSDIFSFEQYSVNMSKAPAELTAIIAEVNAMLATRDTLIRTLTIHDTYAKMLLQISGTDIKTTAVDPTEPLRNRWAALLKSAPLLDRILGISGSTEYTGYGSGYNRRVTKEGQASLDHYFDLLAK